MSSSDNQDSIILWIVVERVHEMPKLVRHGPYSNAKSDRDHEAKLFQKDFVKHHLEDEQATFGPTTTFFRNETDADAIEKAFIKLLDTGERQKIRFRGGNALDWGDWGWIRMEGTTQEEGETQEKRVTPGERVTQEERANQEEMAKSLTKLIAGEDPGSLGPPKKPYGEGLDLYTVLRRKWPNAMYHDWWIEHGQFEIEKKNLREDVRDPYPEHHVTFYKELGPEANSKAIGNLETFKDRAEAVKYAKKIAKSPHWHPYNAKMETDLGETEYQFICIYPSEEQGFEEVLVVDHLYISKEGRECWKRPVRL